MTRKPTEDDLEMDQMAETELERLERQYRIMEGDRNNFCKSIRREIMNQRENIRELKAKKTDLSLNLSIIKNPQNKLKDDEIALELASLLKLKSKNTTDVKLQQLQLDELKQQICRVERELSKLRRKDVSDTKILLKTREYEKTIATLEDRLNVATVRYNKVLEENSKLREEVDHLLKERCLYNSISQQMNARLNAGKKTMVELIEQSTLAYDQREEAQVKLRALKERNRQDLLLHGQEMRELERKLDHDSKLHLFLEVKGEKRVLADLEAREAQRKKAQREAKEAMIAKFESILSRIQEFSGETDIDRLAAQFIKQEEENFALFNYVNEVNNELELIHDQVQGVQTKIDDQHQVNKQRTQHQQETLGKLQRDLAERTAEATVEKKALDVCRAVFDRLLVNIELVFKMIGCNNVPILQLLGDNTHVSRHNVMLYLGLIDRRTNEIVNAISFMSRRRTKPRLPAPVRLPDPTEDYDTPRHTVFEKAVPTQPCALCLELEEVTENKEVPSLPETQPEAAERALRRMTARPIVDRHLHNVSACSLPKSKRLTQQRFAAPATSKA